MKLLATDLDGTVVRRDGTMSDRTVEALHAARAAGVHVVLVTGRPLRWLGSVRERLGDLGPVIAYNGAVLFDDSRGVVVDAAEIGAAAMREARERILRAAPDALFAAETLEGIVAEPGFIPAQARAGFVDAGARVSDSGLDLDAAVAQRTVKLLAKRPSGKASEFAAVVGRAVDDVVTMTHSAFDVALLEMSAPGVDKAARLRDFAASLGVAREDVWAFGDMPNDIPMLAWAGTGVAVGPDYQVVADAADRVVGPVHEDSVAVEIERVLKRLA